MSDAALSENRAAALEDAGRSGAMKAAAGETGREARGSHPAARMEGPGAREALRSGPADADSRGAAKPVETLASRKTGRRRGSDMGDSDIVKLMEIAAIEATAKSAAGKTGGDGRRAGVEIRRGAAGAKATPAWIDAGTAVPQAGGRPAGINGLRRLGTRNDDGMAMASPDHGDDDRADTAKAAVPLIAAGIVAGAVPAVVVPAIAAELGPLHG